MLRITLAHPDMLCNTGLKPSGRLEPNRSWGSLCPRPFRSPSCEPFWESLLGSSELYFQHLPLRRIPWGPEAARVLSPALVLSVTCDTGVYVLAPGLPIRTTRMRERARRHLLRLPSWDLA